MPPRSLLLLAMILLAGVSDAPVLPALPAPEATPVRIDYAHAFEHELKLHRHSIPTEGLSSGSEQIGLSLTVSPSGEVLDAKPRASEALMKLWPRVHPQILQWKFKPFEKNGTPVTAILEEYVELVPPERFPMHHVTPPAVRQDSSVSITLMRTVCYGSCPAYVATVDTEKGIAFDGAAYVAQKGKQIATLDPQAVRELARKFVAADFYSMDPEYRYAVTDNPTYTLKITIDGRTKEIKDYVGQSVGMPAIIVDLENDVDTLAQTNRWIH